MAVYAQGALRIPHWELASESHPSWGVRHPTEEDDNKRIAKKIKRHNKKNRMCNLLKSLSPMQSPFSISVAPQERHFRWMVSSLHLPKSYIDNTVQEPSWCVLLRFMLVDLPSQVRVVSPLHSWRDHLVKKEPKVKKISGCQHKYRRRIIFSEQDGGDKSQALTGGWCAVAYVMSNDREWLEQVDAGKLVSFDGAICIRAFERIRFVNPPCSKWQIFYKLWQEEGLRRRAAYAGPIHLLYDPLPADRALISGKILMLRDLMDSEASSVLYGSIPAP